MSASKARKQYVPDLDMRLEQWAASNASSYLDYMSQLDIDIDPRTIRNSGLICTIGPMSRSVPVLSTLIENGMNVARLNFSHGTHEYHMETIANVRKAAEEEWPHAVGIALDTKGPEIRTGLLKGGGSAEVSLKKGQQFKLTTDKEHFDKGDGEMVYVDYTNITKVVQRGGTVYIDDGLIQLKVLSKGEKHLLTEVQNDATLGSKKGVNLPNCSVDLPALSEQDKKRYSVWS